MPNTNVNSRTLKLAKMGLMVAIAVVCSLVHFPILPAAPHLEFEVMDIPILIAGFAFGPLAGFVIGLVSIGLSVLLGIAQNPPFGPVMHIIGISVCVLVASLIYKKFKTKKWGLLALIIGGLCMVAALIPANIIVTPLFLPFLTVDDVLGIIVPILLPFNLLKVVINTVVVFLLYKRLSPFLHKW